MSNEQSGPDGNAIVEPTLTNGEDTSEVFLEVLMNPDKLLSYGRPDLRNLFWAAVQGMVRMDHQINQLKADKASLRARLILGEESQE